jgi:hypothetical protein
LDPRYGIKFIKSAYKQKINEQKKNKQTELREKKKQNSQKIIKLNHSFFKNKLAPGYIFNLSFFQRGKLFSLSHYLKIESGGQTFTTTLPLDSSGVLFFNDCEVMEIYNLKIG